MNYRVDTTLHPESEPMNDPESARNRAVAIRWFEEIWNQRRTESIDELWAPGGVGHIEGGPTVSKEDFKEARRQLLDALSDFRVELLDVRADGETVFIQRRFTGTHDGLGLGIPPSGRTVDELGLTKLVFRDGRMVEGWDSWNRAAMLARLSTPTLSEIQRVHGLTVRQAEVARLMVERRSAKEIARTLDIRPNTARRHCQAVLRRLGLHNRNHVAGVLLEASESA